MNAIAAVAAVQARIGGLEHRLGVRRTAPVDLEAIAAATTRSSVASFGDLTPRRVTGVGGALPNESFDSVFAAAVKRLEIARAGATEVFAPPAPSTTADPQAMVGFETPYADLFNEAGARSGIPPRVLAAIGWVESRFQTDAVSSAGAVGMMQFLPSTAASMGVDPHDPTSAIDGTARYLRAQLDRFGSLEQAIAAYNVGPGAVARSGVQPGSQAARYVAAVLDATEPMS